MLTQHFHVLFSHIDEVKYGNKINHKHSKIITRLHQYFNIIFRVIDLQMNRIVNEITNHSKNVDKIKGEDGPFDQNISLKLN